MEIINTRNLSKIYDGMTKALDDVSISINQGDWTSITGPSGSGKTTLLNMIGCLDSPSSGRIIVNKTSVAELTSSELTRFRRSNIGLIFQQHYLIPYLTALENVMLAMYFHSNSDEERAAAALERVELSHRLDHIPSKLSGGEQQRVCIARALINHPKILVADEPTGNLDQKNGKRVLNLIKELQDDGHTILLVTHDPKIAEEGNNILQMVDGRILSQEGN
jgi:putative ABC transport system ATP-binding protein